MAFIDDQGYWGLLHVSGGSGDKSSAAPEAVEARQDDEPEEMDADLVNELFADDDDDDENSFSIRAIKRETGFLSDDDTTMSK